LLWRPGLCVKAVPHHQPERESIIHKTGEVGQRIQRSDMQRPELEQ
jgi:hypothetical protein